MAIISSSIKRLMANQQMTVKTLSDKSGVSLTHLYDIVADRVPDKVISVGILEQIAKALNSSLAEITQEIGFVAIKKIREQLSETEIELVDKILSLKVSDWRRKAIMVTLGINRTSESSEIVEDDDTEIE